MADAAERDASAHGGVRMSAAEMPDTIWTYDKNGNRLHGRPNYAKPGVAERVAREVFETECEANPPRSSLDLLLRLREINAFEERMAKREPHIGTDTNSEAGA